MIRYLVTTYPDREQANLSRPGEWGNLPYPTVNDAKDAARDDAGASPFVVDVERAKRRQWKAKP